MITSAINLLKRFKSDGPARTVRLMGARSRAFVRSYVEDRRRGLTTSRVVKSQEPEIHDSRCHWYVATDYETFEHAMRHVEVGPRDVFVDFGSGKGRIVILAGALPFAKVLGIEFSEQLHEVAVENLEIARPAFKCRDAELILGDATQWRVPDEATVLFFFNPFEGEILAKVCENIRRSLVEAPRKLTIVYVRAEKFFEKEIAWESWLVRTHELECLEGKLCIYQSRPNLS